jgi:hypothetical protein
MHSPAACSAPKRTNAYSGASEHDLLVRIVDMLGMPPGHVLAKAAHTRKYFGREEEVVSVGGVAMRHTKYRVRQAQPARLLCCCMTVGQDTGMEFERQ